MASGTVAVSEAAVNFAAGQTTRRRFTNIWKNEDGTWRLFVRHATVIPNR